MIYIVFDFETTGPSPAVHAALSLGAVAVRHLRPPERTWLEGSLHLLPSEFSVNIAIPDNRSWDPHTQQWWLEQDPRAQEAWSELPSPPRISLLAFYAWVESLRKNNPEEKIVFVANPASYDMMYLQVYTIEFTPEWFRFAPCLDMSTLAMAAMGVDYPEAKREFWPEEWKSPDLPHTHVAIEDARAQAHEFMRMFSTLKNIHFRNNPPAAVLSGS